MQQWPMSMLLHQLCPPPAPGSVFAAEGTLRATRCAKHRLPSALMALITSGFCQIRLPSAHTCFNHLLLPEYDTKEQLEERCLTALSECASFHII